MGWIDDDGRHEGYLAPMFADGAVSSTTSNRGVHVTRDRDGRLLAEEEVRPYEDLIGWQLRCHCAPAGRHGGTTWQGSTWRRVATPEAEDVAQRRIYAPGKDIHIDDRPDVERLAVAEWREHLDPHHTNAVRDLAELVDDTTRRLDDAVRGARAAGATWAEIGEAAGMARQSAHERWSNEHGPAT